MGLVNLPFGSGNSGANEWGDVYSNDNALATGINNIEAANLASNAVTTAKITDANVTDAKLASPNNSTYKTILTANAWAGTDSPAATYPLAGALLSANSDSGSDFAVGPVLPPMIYFDDADYTVGSLTQKLRVRAQVNTNATAWSSVTATFGLYPVTFAGSADALTVTLGTVVSGSTVAIANPSASTTNQGNSGDLTIPSDGQYCLGVVTSATLTNNAAALLTAQLQTRNV